MPNLIGIGIYVRNSPKAVELYQAARQMDAGGVSAEGFPRFQSVKKFRTGKSCRRQSAGACRRAVKIRLFYHLAAG